MSSKAYSGEDVFVSSANQSTNDPSKNTAPFLRCPEAMQVLPHVCSYAANQSTFVTPSYDLQIGVQTGPGGQPILVDKPARTTQLLPFNVLVWDTNVQPGMEKDVGYVVAGDIDGQRMWNGASVPEYR